MTTPKLSGFKMPAEWHAHACCWMAWPCHLTTWKNIGLKKAQLAYAKVAQAIVQYEPVMMLVNPGDEKNASTLCGKDVRILTVPLDDSWTRDIGPTFLLGQEKQLAGVDWIHNAWGENYHQYGQDNEVAEFIIKKVNAKHYKASIVMEGGSFHVDGEGTLLTTKQCLLNPNRNAHLSQIEIEQCLQDFLGIEKIIWLNQGLIGDETDGHVDEIATFIAPGKVLCLISNDKNDENYDLLQENLAILKSSKDLIYRNLQVYTVEQPPETYFAGKRLPLSYVNFYRANNGIVIPAFGYEKHDRGAYDLFRRLFPHDSITQINALDIFSGGGGLHCITQQQPKSKF